MDSEAGIFSMTFDQSGSRLITTEADKTIKIYKEDESAVSMHETLDSMGKLFHIVCQLSELIGTEGNSDTWNSAAWTHFKFVIYSVMTKASRLYMIVKKLYINGTSIIFTISVISLM